jgi:hypothetical protein
VDANPTYSVRRYREEDGPRLLALLESAYGSWPATGVAACERPLDFLHWKHLANPAGASMLTLAESGGELIAARAYMEWPLECAGRTVPGRQAVDLATDPAFRRQGINSGLIKRGMDSYGGAPPLTLGSPNGMSRPQSTRQGWRVVGRTPLWVHPLRRGRGHAEPDAPPASEVLAADEPLRNLLGDRASPGERLATPTDADHLRWRHQPLIADYRAVTDHDGDRLLGLAIFRMRRRRELWEAAICELLVRPGDDRVARRLLRRVAEAAPADYLAALPGPRSVASRVLARAGFAPSPAARLPLGVVAYAPLEPDPYRQRSWALSLGDFERLQNC